MDEESRRPFCEKAAALEKAYKEQLAEQRGRRPEKAPPAKTAKVAKADPARGSPSGSCGGGTAGMDGEQLAKAGQCPGLASRAIVQSPRAHGLDERVADAAQPGADGTKPETPPARAHRCSKGGEQGKGDKASASKVAKAATPVKRKRRQTRSPSSHWSLDPSSGEDEALLGVRRSRRLREARATRHSAAAAPLEAPVPVFPRKRKSVTEPPERTTQTPTALEPVQPDKPERPPEPVTIEADEKGEEEGEEEAVPQPPAAAKEPLRKLETMSYAEYLKYDREQDRARKRTRGDRQLLKEVNGDDDDPDLHLALALSLSQT